MTDKQTNLVLTLLVVLFAAVVLMGSLVTRPDHQGAMRIDADRVNGTVNLSNTAANYTLPRVGYPYLVCSRGNRSFVRCDGSNATTSAGGYTFSVPDGACLGPFVINQATCSHIAATAAGQIEFVLYERMEQ